MSGTEDLKNKGKRKADPEEDVSGASDSDGEEEEDLDKTTVDVDFDFFDPKPIDFHGLKSLLKQTFSNDAENMDISGLADLIIAQEAVGTMVKCDGKESDPYAVLTVVNLNGGKDKNSSVVQELRTYLLEKVKKNPDIHIRLNTIFTSDSPSIALVFNERLLNMPPQIVPPMFKMLLEELEWAVEDGEPYNFDYFIFVSKVYKEIESSLNEEEDGEGGEERLKPKKKKKKKAAPEEEETPVFYFQPEDEIIQQHAELSFDFRFRKEAQVTDSRRAFQDFGIDPSRRLFLVKKEKMKTLLKEFEKVLQA
ncbi:Mss4p nuclear export [Rhizophlyctis rosea]|uniref:Protein BCP1 n=1 Tax=Rhizophlyctis rosea TaxID=64517 RepID=A0AAD5S3L8_9FUNG|nr:Mss4p nuclear export [Rhizophlyctis rosea]